jgi:hypothetical protein
MGSVVKSIGRVFKKAGKALKKIAPVLLVAAAAYVGYGYATGFSGGGWPQITGWGKSLMSGIRGGSSLSQAASQASQGFVAPTSGMATSAVTTPASFTPDVVGEVTGGTTFLGPNVEPFNPITTQGGGLLGGTQPGFLERTGTAVLDTLVPPAGASDSPYTAVQGFEEMFKVDPENNPSLLESLFGSGTAQSVPTSEPVTVADAAGQAATGATTNPYIGNPAFETRPRYFGGDLTGEDALLADTTGAQLTGNDFISLFKDKAGKAWQFYKELWKNDPMIALYGTNKVIQMVAALLAEDEKDKRYEYGGFNPDVSYSQLRDIQGSRTKPAPKPGTVLGPRTGLLSNPQGANV